MAETDLLPEDYERAAELCVREAIHALSMARFCADECDAAAEERKADAEEARAAKLRAKADQMRKENEA